MKRRIDQLLVERGLAESRHKAQALLIAGQVLVDEQKVDKPGRMVDARSAIRILESLPFAGRAGAKLQAALDHFHISVRQRVCADLGASTGGFTDCLLQNGASLVCAFDVGKAQLAWKLRSDPRVVVRDEFNVRNITADDLPDGISLVTADLSFISLTKILCPLRDAIVGKWAVRNERSPELHVDLILLVKPQFEVGKGMVGKGGIVRDDSRREEALQGIQKFAGRSGFEVVGSIASPVRGSKGNLEFLLYLKLAPDLSSSA
jgi:23S rRNA (cytidine1920-2'-O)/16S rRNA (cytidine1409-2'-O)-methyltransferase